MIKMLNISYTGFDLIPFVLFQITCSKAGVYVKEYHRVPLP